MKLIKAEIIRLYNNRFFCSLVILLILLNSLLTYAIAIDKSHSKITAPPESYKKLYQDYHNDQESVIAYMEGVFSDSLTFSDKEDFSKYKYTGNYLKESILFSDLKKNAAFCSSYDNFVDELINKSQNTLTVNNANSLFQKRAKKKYIDSYEELKGISLEADVSKGVLGFAENRICDIVICLFVILLVTVLFVNDREQGVLVLLKTGYHGRRELFLAKAATTIVLTSFFVMLSYGLSLIIFYTLFGFGDINRVILSVTGFEYSVWNISVLQYFILTFFLKLTGWITTAIFVLLMAVISKSSLIFYLLQVVYWGIGLLFSGFFGINSLLGNINTISVINIQDSILKPWYINIFGFPADVIPCYILLYGIAFLTVLVLSSVIFVNQQEAKLCSNKKSLFDFKGRLCRVISTSFHENYKFWLSGGALTILVIYIVFTCFTYKSIDEQVFIIKGDEQVYIDRYIDILAGAVTDEKLHFLENEKERYEELQSKLEELKENDKADYQIIKLYEDELKSRSAFDYVFNTLTPLLQKRGGAYVHQTGFGLLTGKDVARYKDIELAVMWCIVTLFPLCILFGRDYQMNMYRLLFCTEEGKKKIMVNKILIAVIFSFLVYIITYAPYYYAVISEYGILGIHENVSSLLHLKGGTISILSYIILINVFRLGAALSCVIVIAVLSKKLKNVMYTLVIMLSLTVLPLMFSWMI